MGLDGEPGGLLDELHADGCTGKEFNTCEPVAFEGTVSVVLMVWCGDCSAAAYRLVPPPA